MLAIWNEFVRSVSDAAPAFAVGPTLSAGVQWLVARSHRAARALSWVAQSVPGAALAGATLPGCAMTTVPPAIPLKRQGAGDGPLLAFIITSALLGPASIVLTFTMFGWYGEFFAWPCRSLRFAYLAGDCSVSSENQPPSRSSIF
jgi:uncharacterized membrane protein YraQ (UPF0718 family)